MKITPKKEIISIVDAFPKWEGTVEADSTVIIGVQFWEKGSSTEFVRLYGETDLQEAQNLAFRLTGIKFPIRDR
jgi:hypothetical protein